MDAELLDLGGVLVTEIGPGSPGQALTWYGGGAPQPYVSAAIVLPATLDVARGAELSFDAFLAMEAPGDIRLYVARGACGPVRPMTVRRLLGWQRLSMDLPPCADGTGVVIYVGEVYESPRSTQALRLDNIGLEYTDASSSCTCPDGVTRACHTGPPSTENVGACRSGHQDCLDGAWTSCLGEVPPGAEACNEVDDDCDGAVDEGFDLSSDALNCGACNNRCTVAVQECYLGSCRAVPRPEEASTCDGIDNDYDGVIDGQTTACMSPCGSGSQTCTLGAWTPCDAPLPEPESCEGTDDDCDGTIDEGCACLNGATQPCYGGPPGTQGVGVFPCMSGGSRGHRLGQLWHPENECSRGQCRDHSRSAGNWGSRCWYALWDKLLLVGPRA